MNQVAKRDPPRDLAQLLTSQKGEIERALPKHLTPDRMLRICLTEIRKNPKLKDCDPFSFMGAVIQSAQLGLEPGSGLGHAYLVPYGKQVTFIPGYKGLVDLARRSGKIKAMHSYLVYAEDKFEEGVQNGSPYINFVPARTGKLRPDSEILMAFAVAEFTGGGSQWTVMERWEIDKIRDGLRYVSDVWKLHYGEMAKKTAVRRLCKMLPQSPELVAVQELDDQANAGIQRSHQVFIDAGVIDAGYDPDPAQEVDAEKNKAVHAAVDTAPANDAMKNAEAIRKKGPLEEAMNDLAEARKRVTEAGMNADDILRTNLKGKGANDVLLSKDDKLIAAAADILNGALK